MWLQDVFFLNILFCYAPLFTASDLFTDHVQQQSASTQQGSAPEWTQKEVSGRLIVRFKSYKPAAAHKAELAVSVAGEGSAWTWIDRTNAATAYPTDFALLDVLDSEADKVKVRFTCTYCIQTTKAQAAWCCLLFCCPVPLQSCHCMLHSRYTIMQQNQSPVFLCPGTQPIERANLHQIGMPCLLLLCCAMQEQLQLLANVKDVHPEQQVKRSLTWDTKQEQQQTSTEWVQKRPGRCVSVITCHSHLLQNMQLYC